MAKKINWHFQLRNSFFWKLTQASVLGFLINDQNYCKESKEENSIGKNLLRAGFEPAT